jgi:hypothetical protein
VHSCGAVTELYPDWRLPLTALHDTIVGVTPSSEETGNAGETYRAYGADRHEQGGLTRAPLGWPLIHRASGIFRRKNSVNKLQSLLYTPLYGI